MLISRKTCPVLLWGMCVLLSVNSTNVTTPENGSDNPTTVWMTADNKEKTTGATWAPSHKPAEVSAVTAEVRRTLPTEETEKNRLATSSSSVNTVGPTAGSTAVSLTSVQMSHSSTEATTTNWTAPSSGSTTVTEGVKHTEDQHQQSASTVTSEAATTTTSTPRPPVVFSTQSTVITELENTSQLSSTTSSKNETMFIHSASTSVVPATSTAPVNPISVAASTHKTRSSPNETTESHISTDGSHVPQFSSTSSSPLSSSQSAASSGSPTASISTESTSSSTAWSTSPAAIPLGPKKFPNPKTMILLASTATPRHVPESTAGTKVQTCSNRSVANRCLIVIACLALLATIFMVSTIVLCTKLSAKKYRVRRSQQGTEMICISALLPERSHSYRRQHNPVSNGVLVFPRTGDSDEDGGDNLTLSSFLPDNDRYV